MQIQKQSWIFSYNKFLNGKLYILRNIVGFFFIGDQRNCLQLHETGVRTGLTSLTTDATQVSG